MLPTPVKFSARTLTKISVERIVKFTITNFCFSSREEAVAKRAHGGNVTDNNVNTIVGFYTALQQPTFEP